ncbi:MAG: polymerase [Treponema sp.]|nr:polymerase [Treponema sp.]
MKRGLSLFVLILFTCLTVYGQGDIGISGSVEWDSMLIKATVTLDLASAGLRLPAGRTQAEAILRTGYTTLIQPGILSLQVDSSSTVADLIERGEFTLAEINTLANSANSIAPALSSDMRSMSTSHTISINNLSSMLLRHIRPSPVIRTLNPVSTAQYTGIIIIASEELPVHGMRGTAMPIPCLFPKIWDSEMNLIYDRNMLETGNTAMVRYSTTQNIFQNNPTGLSPELREIAGDRPLRIFARGVFGINPTDLIIDRSDALSIISSEENRRLLSQGKVVIILNQSVLVTSY